MEICSILKMEKEKKETEDTNMVNFKKMYDDWWDSLPKERQEEILRRKALEKEHLYYETKTLLDQDQGLSTKEEWQEVKLYRDVLQNGELSKTIVLSFGGYREYSFDKRFCLKLLRDYKQNPDKRFSIDIGRETYVKNTEMLRIVKESIHALTTRGIEMSDDYFPNLTNSGMGKMLIEMGLH